MHNQMSMMEAQDQHEDFVTNANNLKQVKFRELQNFKVQYRRLLNLQSQQHCVESNANYYDIGGVSSMSTQIQSKVSSTAGGFGEKLDSKRGKKN